MLRYISSFTGFIIILLFFYFRFFKEKLFPDLYFINTYNIYFEINFLLVIICLLFILFSSIMLFFIIKQLINSPINIKNNVIVVLLTNFVSFIKYSLDNFIEEIGNHIPDVYDKIKGILLYFYKVYGHKEYFLIIITIIIPYSITSLCFLIEVFFFFRLKFFYYTLILLIIPLVLNFILYLIEKLCSNLNTIADLISIKHRFLSDGRDQFIFTKKENNSLSDDEFDQYRIEYLTLYPLKGFMEDFNILKNNVNLYIRLILYCSYFVGWLFVLLKNIIIITLIYIILL